MVNVLKTIIYATLAILLVALLFAMHDPSL